MAKIEQKCGGPTLPGGGGTPYNGLYGKATPARGTPFSGLRYIKR